MERIIHIHAKSDRFEIFEQVPEDKSVQRLIQIKNLFNGYGKFAKMFRKNTRVNGDKLTVTTRLVNPELPFKYF